MKQNNIDTAIILISEITKGMKSIGSKSLLKIDTDLTPIDHQIQYLKKYYNPIRIILCTGFDHEKIINHVKKYKNVDLYYNSNYLEDNQSGSLIKCLKTYNPKNALILTNGLLLFDKIKINSIASSTYFIDTTKDKRNYFEIGSNNINKDGYLFYDLDNKWIELLFLQNEDVSKLVDIKDPSGLYKLFLFELINKIRNIEDHSIEFIKLSQQNIYPIKINNIKDLTYAKKYYKKYKPISN